MNFSVVSRITARVMIILLLAGSIWAGLFTKGLSSRISYEWLHTFCLTQTILLAACAIYGPGTLVARKPIVVAWALAVGFALAMLNLISLPGRSSLFAGAILTITGTLPSVILFAIHRWRTKVSLVFSNSLRGDRSRSQQQLSLQMLLLVTAAFALAGMVARAAVNAPTDPFGGEQDFLVMHAWLGFFPCLAAAPALLVVFRPSWKILLVGCFFVLVSLGEPILFALVARYIFIDQNMVAVELTGEALQTAWMEATMFNGQALVATVIYALLARAAGLRMVIRDQSNDKNPNPSGQPVTEAGCVQD
ncbi:MAG: hypothetical protein H6821_09710 [Planctomycetaceae bacterium]|nr:hypothetical protein [Planctomycetaceae bacterium]